MSMYENPNAFATAVHTLAVSIANQLGDEDLALYAAIFAQLGDVLETIAVCRARILPVEMVQAKHEEMKHETN